MQPAFTALLWGLQRASASPNCPTVGPSALWSGSTPGSSKLYCTCRVQAELIQCSLTWLDHAHAVLVRHRWTLRLFRAGVRLRGTHWVPRLEAGRTHGLRSGKASRGWGPPLFWRVLQRQVAPCLQYLLGLWACVRPVQQPACISLLNC